MEQSASGQVTAPSASSYGPEYYRTQCGERPYERCPEWLSFFGSVAEHIILTLRPDKILDAGCAMGLLVESFWDRGVEAWGIDISTYAVSQVRTDLGLYCQCASLVEPIAGRFDLVTCIEVLEHIPETECLQVVRNLTAVTDRIVFSSTPSDLSEPTHCNVRPILAWLRLFAGFGFHPECGYDASFIAPHAMLLRRGEPVRESEQVAFAGLLMERCEVRRLSQTVERFSAAGVSSLPDDAQRVADLRGAYRGLAALYGRRHIAHANLLGRAAAAWAAVEQLGQVTSALRAAEELSARREAEGSELRARLDQLTSALRTAEELSARKEAERAELSARLDRAAQQTVHAENQTRDALSELRHVRERAAAQRALDQQQLAAARNASDRERQEIARILVQLRLARSEMEHARALRWVWWMHRGWRRWSEWRAACRAAITSGRSLRELPTIVAARRIAPLVDEPYYFRTYPEAGTSGFSAAEHYVRTGAGRHFNPSPVFDTAFYLRRYPDVAAKGMNPLLHYVASGAVEGRDAQVRLAGGDDVSADPPRTLSETTTTVAAPQPPITGSAVQASRLTRLPDTRVVVPHEKPVTVIVTVHNALDDVRRCLHSLIRHTVPPYDLVLVDDGSDPATRDYLREFAVSQDALLLRNDVAKGYTFAANQGLRAAQGEHVVLLNSDTIVAEQWLDRVVMCAESDPRIGLVGPLSNTASWQSVPAVHENGDWAANPIPDGLSVGDMARLIAAFSGRTYPRMAFLNGFCLLLKRRVIEDIGYFDEENFGRGYGEENDYCLRARAAGWVLAVADDTYIYHAQGRSYSNERRKQLYEHADRMLHAKHDSGLIARGVRQCQDDLVLLGLRARAGVLPRRKRLIDDGRRLWEGARVVFILPVGGIGGGANVVLTEARAMQRFGVDALVLNLTACQKSFRQSYPDPGVRMAFAPSEDAIPDLVSEYDAVIATANQSVSWMQPLVGRTRSPRLGYYIQDFEPHFFAPGSVEHQRAVASYTAIPNLVRFTKTEWNRDELRAQVGVDAMVVGPSCDVDLFRPRTAERSDKLRVCAMIRPSSARRGARETMERLAEIDRVYGERVEIQLFGDDPGLPLFLDLPRGFRWTHYGCLTREHVASLLSTQDVFADFSHYQAMGLTAMEAMATGLGVIVPQAGGATSFAVHGTNALAVDTSRRQDCLQAIASLVEDASLLARIRRRALADVVAHVPEQSAFNILSALFGDDRGSRHARAGTRG